MMGAPIPEVRVLLDGPGAITNQNGEFSVTLTKPQGNFVLRFVSPDWRTPDIPIINSASSKDIALGNVFMEAADNSFVPYGDGIPYVDLIHFAVPQTLDFKRLHAIRSVSVRNGNIYATTSDGQIIWITSSGLDSDPSLSPNKHLIVFVRQTPTFKIDTGLGATNANELWIANASGNASPRRILIGHPGGHNADENLVLAGFASPRFSRDGHRIHFLSQTWATGPSAWTLDLASGKVDVPRQ